jgi:hypothetical protein
MSYSEPSPPGLPLLTFGVILPTVAFLVELATGLCASAFFDPIPTWGHALAVLAVPAINYFLWAAARRDDPPSPWLMTAAGTAMAIAFVYTLIFLPMLPIALIGVLIGLGFLPWSPVLALVASAKLAGRWVGEAGHSLWRWLGGVLVGLAALIAVDLPATATFLAVGWAGGDPASARRGTALMRTFGDEGLLLRLCYGEGGRAVGLASFAVSTWNEGAFSQGAGSSTSAARELYYRVTGQPFNSAEPPALRSQGDLWGFDEDQGGTSVGGRARGLRLATSRLDGSVAADDNLAYVEWTAVFANAQDFQQEARLTLALPPGAVASRATLWVNGEPREASVAGRGEARAAYENVVRARRDPLLVTTDGAGRLLVQAFPVPPRASLKLRIGITAPLEISPDGARSFALPAIAERNFELPADLRHQIWIEGGGLLGTKHEAFRRSALAPGVTRLRAALDDGDLARRRPRIAAPRVEAPAARSATLPATPTAPAFHIVQTIARAPLNRPRSLILLLDASATNRASAAALGRALDTLPAGLPVGLFIAAEEPREVAPAPWSPAQASRIRQALRNTTFGGGQDNLPALADALEASAGAGSALLWVHGPQPVDFAQSRARLEQVLERSRELPSLVRYQAEAGPAFTMAGHAWFEAAREAPPSGDAGADLAALVARLSAGGEGWQVSRAEGAGRAGPASSTHIARLWGADRLATAAGTQGREREKAIALAHRLNIVTPVSGAVVLETDGEYKRAGLAVPNAADVPTVPEPETWALIALVAALLLWQYRRLGRRRTALA